MLTPFSCAVNLGDESGQNRKRRLEAAKPEIQVPVAGKVKKSENGGKKETDKASDDFYFEKFRRQFRR